MTTARAFTLIELLVVITIIVVLLAMLTPALDKAIYEAELVQCGAQLDSILTGTIQYAMNFNRRYPNRPELDNMQTIEITEQGRGWDLRPIIKGFFPVNHLTCPLSGEVDIENSAPDTTFVFSSYDYWVGWRYFTEPGAKGMIRMGDRFTSIEDGSGQVRSFNLLASDRDVTGIHAQVQSSHPDRDGVLGQLELQEDENYAWGLADGAAAYGTITIALWRNPVNHTRGPLDRNFGYQDGSVTRLLNLIVKPSGLPDDRLVTAPHYSNSGTYAGTSTEKDDTYHTALPRE
jgi:prepilin-type N-terminal cleavage/methylation domain-containing protein